MKTGVVVWTEQFDTVAVADESLPVEGLCIDEENGVLVWWSKDVELMTTLLLFKEISQF